MGAHRIAVAISTYRRPQELAKLLDSLRTAYTGPRQVDLIVADNDPGGSARQICQSHDVPIDYVHEPRPGIVHCRNAALSRVNPRVHAYIAIIDDDEWVEVGWLDELMRTMEHLPGSKPDVVAGPVVSVLPRGAPNWVSRGGFHQRPRQTTGKPVALAATNNVLIRVEALLKLNNPRFDQEFADTGGSDSELFWRMRQAGARLVWCDEAVVMEDVPLERCTAKWIARRAIRLGNVHGRLELRSRRRITVIASGLARVVYGASLLVLAALFRRRAISRAVTTLGRGMGMIGAVSNKLVHEYVREPAA